MMEVKLNQVICISLKSHNEAQLDAIGAKYNINLECLLKAKNEGCKMMWVHKGGGVVIAGLDTNDITDVYFSPDYLPMTGKLRKAILSIKPVKTPKMAKLSKPKKDKTERNIDTISTNLDLDTILDKINEKGMSSLTDSELNFLRRY